ncbi:Protein tyrosine phosphatase type IVA 3 [Galdieria sulphuraria]|nr:Protein tyrosine phosphatase type IVA 3 [Galdieria sulphuraria]
MVTATEEVYDFTYCVQRTELLAVYLFCLVLLLKMTTSTITRSLSAGELHGDNSVYLNNRTKAVDKKLVRIAVAKQSLAFRSRNNSSSGDKKEQILVAAMKDLEASKQPTFVEFGRYVFLITGSPSDDCLNNYMDTLKRAGVKHVVRLCESLYNAEKLVDAGFKHHDWPFEDGGVPSGEIIQKWLSLLSCVTDNENTTKTMERAGFQGLNKSSSVALRKEEVGDNSSKISIALHCKTGLGRAPVMVAIALIEMGMDALDAIGYIRARRRGAINSRQLLFLEQYKPKGFHNLTNVRKDERPCRMM